ncbi:family 16 glycosylhydrolase [Dongia sp.]|uniref:glycoside hydrolase family 16 protein n=1 Tax=Dongia sp. TaxID=1977262 RepID=UPI00375335C8
MSRQSILRSGRVLGLLLACGLAAGPPAQAGWKPVFREYFDGTALNRNTWYTRFIYKDGTQDRLNQDQQVYRDGDHHIVANGILHLVATKAYDDGRAIAYESGMIRSRQTFRYGYFEARIKLPSGRGLFPAFWLNSDYGANGRLDWPPEIDIMEYAVNGTTERPNMVHSGLRVDNPTAQGGTLVYNDTNYEPRWGFFNAPVDMSKDWHTYGLLWEPDSVTVFLDGRKLWVRTYRWVYSDAVAAGPAHILLNLAVGGPWAGLNGVDDTALPAGLQIDYVIVCQRSAAVSAKRCAGSPYTPK